MKVGFFFPNHRVDMQAGVGLHMSHARQNLGTLGWFKTPLCSKKVFWGTKKGYISSKILNGGIFVFSLLLEGLVCNIWGPYEPSPANFGFARGCEHPQNDTEFMLFWLKIDHLTHRFQREVSFLYRVMDGTCGQNLAPIRTIPTKFGGGLGGAKPPRLMNPK